MSAFGRMPNASLWEFSFLEGEDMQGDVMDDTTAPVIMSWSAASYL